MTAINFPDSPSNGDTHVVGGVTYTYDSTETKWKTTINSNAFLPLTGGTLSGNLTLGSNQLTAGGLTYPTSDGTTGQYLQTDGAGALSFQTVASSGTVLNTYTATDTAGRTTTSGTFTAAGNTASVTLTPASANSKFLIFLTTTMNCSDGDDGWILTLFRDTTNLAADAVDGFLQGNSVPGVVSMTFPVAIAHLDSPNTTSQIVYQPQFRVIDYDSDGGSARIGYTANGSSGGPAIVLTVLEIGG